MDDGCEDGIPLTDGCELGSELGCEEGASDGAGVGGVGIRIVPPTPTTQPFSAVGKETPNKICWVPHIFDCEVQSVPPLAVVTIVPS